MLSFWTPLLGDTTQQGLSTYSITTVGSGATVNTNGKLGKCYYFDGTANGYINTNFPTNVGTDDFTISLWVKIPTISSGSYYAICTSKTNAAAGVGFGIYWNYSQKKFLWSTADGTNATEIWMADSVDSIVYDKWIHLVMVRNNSDAKKGYFYINGTRYELASVPAIRNIATASYLMVGKCTNGSYPCKMYVNDLRVYVGTALSAKEVKALSQGLVCHYPLSGANNTLLPFGYQQLEYIESAGAAAFDTKYKFNPETDSIKMTFKGNDTSNDGMLFGQSAAKYFWLYYYGSNGIRIYADNGSGQQSIAGISSDLNRHTAEYKNKHYYIDGTDKGSLSNTYAEQTTTSWICSYGSTSYGFKGRIYFAQVCRSGVPQRTFIPAKRLSDSKVGMYDVSNDVFYPSDTSTAFTAGTVVGTPSTVYDTSGFKNDGETYAYDTTGSIECSSDTARYSLSTFINSANVTNNATGIRYIYGNCELTTPQYLTVAFWCKPIAGYGNYAHNGLFALTNNDIGTGAATDFNTAPMHNRDAYIDMCTSTNVHKTLSFSGTLNEWHHYAVVYDGRYGKAYIDGVQTATLDMNSNLSLASFKAIVLGYSHAGGVYRKLRAYYSDFRIYATALSADDVKKLYNTVASVSNTGVLLTRGEIVEQ